MGGRMGGIQAVLAWFASFSSVAVPANLRQNPLRLFAANDLSSVPFHVFRVFRGYSEPQARR